MDIKSAGEGHSTHVESKFIEFKSENKDIKLRGYSEQDWKKVGIFQRLACFFSGSAAHVNVMKDGKMQKFVIVKDQFFKDAFGDVKINDKLYETLKNVSGGSIQKSGIKIPQEVVNALKGKGKELSQTVINAIKHGTPLPTDAQKKLGVNPADSYSVLMDIERTEVVITKPAERQPSVVQPSRQPSSPQLSRQPSVTNTPPPAQKSAKEQAMDNLEKLRGSTITWNHAQNVKTGLKDAAKKATEKGAAAVKQFNDDLKAVGYRLDMDKKGHIKDVVKIQVKK